MLHLTLADQARMTVGEFDAACRWVDDYLGWGVVL